MPEPKAEAIFLMDREGRVTFLNEAAVSMFGWSPGEIVGESLRERIRPRSDGIGPEPSADSGPFEEREKEFLRRDGTAIRARSTRIPIRSNGEIQSVVKIIVDPGGEARAADRLRRHNEELEARVGARTFELEAANARLEAEISRRSLLAEDLRRSEARFRESFDAAAIGIALVEPGGRFLRVNRSLSEIVGYSQEELLARTFLDLTHPDDLEADLDLVRRMLSGELRSYHLEKRYLHKDGRIVWGLLSVSLVRDDRGEPHHFVSHIQDITPRREAEEALKSARDEALAATRFKTEFLANMSHDIRTPLNAIIGLTELTLDTPLAPEPRENLEIIKSAGDSLLRLVNDLLDSSRIEAGRLELDPVAFDPRGLVASTIRTVARQASEKGLGLTWDVGPEVPPELIGDERRLGQVLMNLVGNALKFTESGEVLVRVALDRPADDRRVCSLRFSVEDTGIGIASEDLGPIFDQFRQADGSISRKFGGTGLGLSICSRLVGLMGGRIGVESRLGVGSTFHFTANFEVPAAGPVPSPTPSGSPMVGDGPAPATGPPRKLRILLVDDSRFNLWVETLTLEKMGHEVVCAEGGEEAVTVFLRGRFDLVLMDVRMPGLDGFETSNRLRWIDFLRSRKTPIVAITACAMPEDRALCLSSGMDGHLSKPMVETEVRRMLEPLSSPESESAWSLDPETIRERYPMEPSSMAEVIRLFRIGSLDTMGEMRAALEAGDHVRLALAAHSLKGSLGMFASDRAIREVEDLERVALSGSLDGAAENLESIARILESLRPLMEELAPGE